MRFRYALAAACSLALPGLILAQTTSTPTRTQTGTTGGAQTTSDLFPMPVYQMNGVGKSLNLSQDQINGLNKLTNQTQAQYRTNYSNLNNLNASERAARADELNQQYNSAWNKGAENILNENQRQRYQQLNYQYGGFNSLNDPAVQKRLNLTAAQKRELRANSDWSNEQMQEINRLEASNPTKASQMYSNYWKERQERFNKFLTPEQQKEWRDLTGEPYAFQPNAAPSR